MPRKKLAPANTPVRGEESAWLRGLPESPGGAAGLDRLIHEPLRLAVVSALASRPSMAFTELRAMLGASDGNLSVHARKLEEAGYVECVKGFYKRLPRTEFRLTPAGRRALAHYLEHMEALIRAARGG
jgi:DNA-binding MarR family transcriptional regulator